MEKLKEISTRQIVILSLLSAGLSAGIFLGSYFYKKNRPAKPQRGSESHKPTVMAMMTSGSIDGSQKPQDQNDVGLPGVTLNEIQKIKVFVVNNFAPMVEEINGLADSFFVSIKGDIASFGSEDAAKKLTKIQVLDILKMVTFSMMDFERRQIEARRAERRKKMASEDYVSECIKPYTKEYLEEFEKSLLAILERIGIDSEGFKARRNQVGLQEILTEPTLEGVRQLVHGKCMVPSRLLKEDELQRSLEFLIAVFYSYAGKEELKQMSFMFPICCEDELFVEFGLNGEEVSGSIYEYCKGKSQKLYPLIREYLRLFVKAI